MSSTDNPQPNPWTHPNQATHVAIVIILVVVAMTTVSFVTAFLNTGYETLIFVAGTVGGAVNSFRRVQSLTTAKAHESSAMTERLVTIQIYVSPIVGGVFAFVLYLIFMAEFVQGSFFPDFAAGKEAYTGYAHFAKVSVPATNADVAKAIVWAFIAGFAEGLVPNFISKIAKEAG